MDKLKDKLVNKIKILNESIWEGKAGQTAVNNWLDNFEEDDQLKSLFLLSNFMYFGSRQMRALMSSLYRDLYRTPIIHQIRKDNGNTLDKNTIEREFINTLKDTIFLGIGNPSESGCHLLYYLRQENQLPKTCFAHTHELFKRTDRSSPAQVKRTNIKHYVFIDDFCGTGNQGSSELKTVVENLKQAAPTATVSYFVLFGTTHGLENIKQNTSFDAVRTVVELDSTFKVFAPDSRYFENELNFTIQEISDMNYKYGSKICSSPNGYGDCQLLIGFHHNIPDNTLPIMWYHDPYNSSCRWTPAFKRYNKIYNW